MADIHSAAQKNDVAFIQASDVVDALVSRSGGGLARRLRCIAMMLRHVAAIPPERRRHQCTQCVRHSPTRSAQFSSGRKCSEHCPRALPIWPKISALGLPPYPLTSFSLGATPTLATPPLSSFLFSSPCMPSPTCCPRAPRACGGGVAQEWDYAADVRGALRRHRRGRVPRGAAR